LLYQDVQTLIAPNLLVSSLSDEPTLIIYKFCKTAVRLDHWKSFIYLRFHKPSQMYDGIAVNFIKVFTQNIVSGTASMCNYLNRLFK